MNPHAFFFINVRDAAGTITNWPVEFGNPIDLEKDGWKRSSLRVGDLVAVEGNPARGDARQAFAKSVVLTRTGKRLFAASATARAATIRQPTPRWPDSQVRLGPPPGRKGYWGKASAKGLVENTGANIPMNDDGLLLNLADVDKVAVDAPGTRLHVAQELGAIGRRFAADLAVLK